jgi:hypothetical protein
MIVGIDKLLVVEGYEVVCFEMDGEIREELNDLEL